MVIQTKVNEDHAPVLAEDEVLQQVAGIQGRAFDDFELVTAEVQSDQRSQLLQTSRGQAGDVVVVQLELLECAGKE